MSNYLLVYRDGSPETLINAVQQSLDCERILLQNYAITDQRLPVFYGHGDVRAVRLMYQLRQKSRPFVEINHNWLGFPEDRGKIYRVTWSDLNVRYNPQVQVDLGRADPWYDRIQPTVAGATQRILICPPTEESASFYGDKPRDWLWQVLEELGNAAQNIPAPTVRTRHWSGDLTVDLAAHDCVIGYNTAVLNYALAQGKHVIGAPIHPVSGLVGISYDAINAMPAISVEQKLHYFAFLAGLQGTIEELRQPGFIEGILAKQKELLHA